MHVAAVLHFRSRPSTFRPYGRRVVVRPTRDAAITALRAELKQRVEQGELISVDIAGTGLASLAGKYANDPTLHEIGRDAYQQRDVDPAP